MGLKQVSIVIPVYNVEEYLPACVDSVLQQTYENIQVILVDDGSTDSSGQICDVYAAQDGRITVIHKENGGLSDARNVGLEKATGDFVFYLDSDDYLEQDAIEILVNQQRIVDADVVVGNYYYTYADHETMADTVFKESTVLDNYEAMEALVTGKIQNFAWAKLIRVEIAKKYEFPKGKLFEDHYWTHLIFGDSQKIVVTSRSLVHYRQREGSISYHYVIQRLDVLDGWLTRKEYLEENYPDLCTAFLRSVVKSYLGTAWLVLTRMKTQKIQAFQRLRDFSIKLQLCNYADHKDKALIQALNVSTVEYCVRAIWRKIVTR